MTTQTRLKYLLTYDEETGEFTRNFKRGGRSKGSVAGTIESNGHRQMRIDGVLYLAHRLAWLYTYGEWPPYELDHINNIRDDNRLCNLRLAKPGQNAKNRKLNKNNISGFKGVSYHNSGRWQAQIQSDKCLVYLGLYETPEEAYEAYKNAALRLHKEFAKV